MDGCGTIIPLELGHYRLVERISGSAYGAVWRAAGPGFGPFSTRDVALKLVNEAQMAQAQPALRQRWIASAEAEIDFLESLAPWDERHIVRLLDCGRHRGLPVMALELMRCDLGRHMQALRQAGCEPPLATVLAWMGQLNQALGKVHQYGWRHLDLKPGNVLVDTQLGLVKLADFGANRRLAAADEHSYTGTAHWQAPEQFFPAAGGGYLTGTASDYFALGALFYFLATGGMPLHYGSVCGQARRDHPHDAAGTVLSRHDGAPPPTLLPDEMAAFAQACGAAAGPALALLRRLLSPDPSARPRHALDISRALAAIGAAAGLPSAAPDGDRAARFPVGGMTAASVAARRGATAPAMMPDSLAVRPVSAGMRAGMRPATAATVWNTAGRDPAIPPAPSCTAAAAIGARL
jgi:eukaryotic-like serine/threonine-protein kinase